MENPKELSAEQTLLPFFLEAGYNCDETDHRKLMVAAKEAMKEYSQERVKEALGEVMAYNDLNEGKFSSEGFEIMNDILEILKSKLK